MIPSVARFPVALVFIFALACSVHAQTQTSTSQKPGSVSGRITIKDKGAAGVMIGLRRPEMNSPFDMPPRAISDQDGNYQITNVAPGSYDIMVTTLAYVFAGGTTSRGRPVVIGEGENVEGINVSLVRGGVITGKVTDPDGRPVVNHQIRLFLEQTDPRPANQRSYPSNTGSTDDRGIYRIFGLYPGRYVVAAGRADEGSVFNTAAQTSYKEVFYPDVVDKSKATPVEVGEGTEATNIDLQLGRPIQLFSVTGRTVDEKGEPTPNVRLALQRLVGERPEVMNSLVMSNASGNFTAENILPGKYSLMMLPDVGSEFRTEQSTFDVLDSDVSGVTVKLIRGASITGVVVLESDNREAYSRLLKLQIMGYITNPGPAVGMGNSARSTIGADGSFRLGGLPGGNALVRLTPYMDMSLIKGLTIARIERDGIVISQSKAFEIKEGEQVTGVRVIVTYGSAAIRGVITLQNGSLPENARLALRLTKAGEANADVPVNMPRVDERGRFLIDNVPPGSYEISTFVVGKGFSPTAKQLVHLQDGATVDVSLTLDMTEKPKPNPQ